MPRNLSQDFVTGIAGHWDFDGDLTDQSGNGFTLTHSGTARFATVGDLQAVWMDLADTLTRVNEAALEITGTLTLHMLVYMTDRPGSLTTLLEFGNRAVSTAPDNVLYAIDWNAATLRYFAEEGAGVDIDFDFEMGLPLRGWHLVTLVRDSGGEVTLYLDGEPAGVASSAALNVPADGTSSTLTIGDANFTGYFGGIMIANTEANADDVWLQYAHVFEIGAQFRDLNENLIPNCRAHWTFNDTLTDRVNSLVLQLLDGNKRERYQTIQGVRCFTGVRAANTTLGYLNQAAHTSQLSVTGELTVHCLYYQYREEPSGSTVLPSLYQYGGSGESQETNVLYLVRQDADRDVFYFAEEGAGTNITFDFEVSWPVWGMHLHTLVRDSGGEVTMYIDGKASGLASSGINPPTTSGVQTQILTLGQHMLAFAMGGLLIAAHGSSPEEVEAMWRWVTRGGPQQRLQPGGSKPVYMMRAFNTSLGQTVTWQAEGVPDMAGVASVYPAAHLSDVRVLRELVR